MLDYIADCPEFIRNNVADSAALTKPLVDEYVSGGYKNIWIVACGSSSNGSLCARQFIRRHLKCEVKIVTPFHFVSSENDFSETDMVVVVSQSGYSLNALDAIKVVDKKGPPLHRSDRRCQQRSGQGVRCCCQLRCRSRNGRLCHPRCHHAGTLLYAVCRGGGCPSGHQNCRRG